MRARLTWVVALAVVLTIGLAGTASTASTPTKIFDNGNIAAVQNGASAPTIFTTTQPWKIVQIYTYHWNNAKGVTPGLIGLVDLTTNKKYGPWQASGLPGQGGVPNAYWLVAPKIDVPAGRYQITDSSPATWAQNSGTGGAGMAIVTGLPAGFSWPAMPDALVPLASVANGCGPGSVSSAPRWGDTSTYKDGARKFTVNFREACNLHDAGYSGAKVRDPLHGNAIWDSYTWSRLWIDDKFLADMRLLCRAQIPASATVARAQCAARGGTLTMGAETRYDLVRKWATSNYGTRPRLSGVWANRADPTEPALALSQTIRNVRGAWKGGKADPGSKAEFRGTVISRADDSVVRGFVKYTDGTGAVSLKAMSITWNPKTPTQITVVGPPTIAGLKVLAS